MRVLVFEPKYVGHFLGFAAWAANAYARIGCEVTLLIPRGARGSLQAKINLEPRLHPKVSVEYLVDIPVLYHKWKNARFESDALFAIGPDLNCEYLIMPSADFLICGLLLNRSLRKWIRRLRGGDFIVHNCKQVYDNLGKKERIWLMLDRLAIDFARNITVHTVDPYAVKDSRRLSLFGTSVHGLPHPFDRVGRRKSRAEARSSLGLPERNCLIGTIGDLGVRKGTELLIRSFIASKPSQDTNLLLFGILSKSSRALIDQHQEYIESGQIILRNEFVSEETFLDFFSAVDLVWAGYPEHIGIASVILHAADAGRPILASNYGCVGWMANRYRLGKTAPPNVANMSEAIRDFSTSKKWGADRAGMGALLRYHTTPNFEQYLTSRCRKLIGNLPGLTVS